MTVQQQGIQHHMLPWWFELVGAALIGAALLFGILLIAGHSDLLPWTISQANVQPVPFPGKAADDLVVPVTRALAEFPGKVADDLITSWPH